MPIVDGLTSAKMIRSYEQTHPQHNLSDRASLNGRVPIIAVSASLIESQRAQYIQGGFDGWILKPISFHRLSELMNGIVDSKIRGENLYKPGKWEHGGWFDRAQPSIFEAKTKPSGEAPIKTAEGGVPSAGVAMAAQSDDPAVKEEDDSKQSQEQSRLLKKQEQERLSEQGEDGVQSSTGRDMTDNERGPLSDSHTSTTTAEHDRASPDAVIAANEDQQT